MDLAALFARGLALGFAIAAAIGPIGLLVIRRTLTEGGAVGIASGLGAATADATYAGVAAFGLTAAADLLVAERRPLGLAGGLVLVVLAMRMLRARPAVAAQAGPGRGLAGAYATTVGLTITNPATILSFAAAFVGFGLIGHGGPGAAALVLGVFAGSAAWWAVLVVAMVAMRGRIGPTGLRRTGIASALLIAALGAAAIAASAWG